MAIFQTEGLCWICGVAADSAEHVFKARDLKRLFDADGYDSEKLPFHFSHDGYSRIQGPKSKKMKYLKVICQKCNNDRTSDFDKAYDQFSDWCETNQSAYGMNQMNLREIFGENYSEGIDKLRRYCAKSLGCQLVALGCVLPDNFPNPVSGENMAQLQISVCRAQLLRRAPNYKPQMGERIFAKGAPCINISRTHLETTGKHKVTDGVWRENVGHFQINHWLNIDINPAFGAPLDGSSMIYKIIESDLDVDGMKDAMWSWIQRDT
jgi:hypothetical protein